jgi:hypothetical protein
VADHQARTVRACSLKRTRMAVIAIFKYRIKPERLPDFMKKLAEAADPKFASPTMPKSVRLFRSTVPGEVQAVRQVAHIVRIISECVFRETAIDGIARVLL